MVRLRELTAALQVAMEVSSACWRSLGLVHAATMHLVVSAMKGALLQRQVESVLAQLYCEALAAPCWIQGREQSKWTR